ncbi:hypothetical protein RIR_jg17417.t2 [Rhizophagus irregularis DAOM 181602=DAOM 197198]|uniref:Uncharacterized protein n=1 Tax=Rhizophagus irregularis (strain DAOM 197198w) TaxID=1432141 RepID=A0A015L9F9_RHIIW|nr:hypothetical protein RirG_098710 [Rhizophagus irregularis DAOM 197198w]GET60048.1 hypothetical protein RIR_jg17417.t2 [Rhizophagus irregularis DAOM 181602=DAOM 197198]
MASQTICNLYPLDATVEKLPYISSYVIHIQIVLMSPLLHSMKIMSNPITKNFVSHALGAIRLKANMLRIDFEGTCNA